jgi:hypothetical protein
MMLITGDIFIGNLKISYDDDVKRQALICCQILRMCYSRQV